MRSMPCVCLLLAAAPLAFAQAPGIISGSVFDERGKPKSGVWVTAVRTSLPPARAAVASDVNGAFVLANLTPGDYRLCMQVVEGGYADLCQWSIPAPLPVNTVTLRAGQGTGGVRLNLQPASRLQIRVNDPQGLLAATNPDRQILVGVMGPARLFQPAPMKSKDAGGRLHEISIPFDTPVQVMIRGQGVTLANASGAAVAPGGATIPVTHAKNAPAPPPVVYTVTGVVHR